jgi:hypothetical protein
MKVFKMVHKRCSFQCFPTFSMHPGHRGRLLKCRVGGGLPGDVAQVAECLPCEYEVQILLLQKKKKKDAELGSVDLG